MVSRLEDTRQFNGHLVRTSSEVETFRMSAMNRYLQEQAKDAINRAQHTTNLGHVLSPGEGDSRSDWRSIQVRALVGTCTCHHDRVHSTMEWICAFHDKTNWCCLVIARKQADQMFYTPQTYGVLATNPTFPPPRSSPSSVPSAALRETRSSRCRPTSNCKSEDFALRGSPCASPSFYSSVIPQHSTLRS